MKDEGKAFGPVYDHLHAVFCIKEMLEASLNEEGDLEDFRVKFGILGEAMQRTLTELHEAVNGLEENLKTVAQVTQ